MKLCIKYWRMPWKKKQPETLFILNLSNVSVHGKAKLNWISSCVHFKVKAATLLRISFGSAHLLKIINMVTSSSGVEINATININTCAFLHLSSNVPSDFLYIRKTIKEHILIVKAKLRWLLNKKGYPWIL